jgi:hypothetical protein
MDTPTHNTQHVCTPRLTPPPPLQALAWISAVTPQQMARLCVRAFPYAPTGGDAILDHILAASDTASAAEQAAMQAAAAEAAAALLAST